MKPLNNALAASVLYEDMQAAIKHAIAAGMDADDVHRIASRLLPSIKEERICSALDAIYAQLHGIRSACEAHNDFQMRQAYKHEKSFRAWKRSRDKRLAALDDEFFGKQAAKPKRRKAKLTIIKPKSPSPNGAA
jgi:hypothetical protein